MTLLSTDSIKSQLYRKYNNLFSSNYFTPGVIKLEYITEKYLLLAYNTIYYSVGGSVGGYNKEYYSLIHLCYKENFVRRFFAMIPIRKYETVSCVNSSIPADKLYECKKKLETASKCFWCDTKTPDQIRFLTIAILNNRKLI